MLILLRASFFFLIQKYVLQPTALLKYRVRVETPCYIHEVLLSRLVDHLVTNCSCYLPSSWRMEMYEKLMVWEWLTIINYDAATKSLQSCLTLCDPIDGSPPRPPSLGFSRQEHWSGLPFPSAMHESEKSKWSRSVMSNSWRPHGLQPTRLLHPWDFPGKSTGVGCHCHIHIKNSQWWEHKFTSSYSTVLAYNIIINIATTSYW